MTSIASAPRLGRYRLARDFQRPTRRGGSRCCRWRRPSSMARICLLETDVMIGEAYLARVRELLPPDIPATFLPVQPVGISTEHIDYPGTLTLPTEVALKSLDGARRERRARRHQETGDGHQPWRQQRRDEPGRAGSARASRPARGDHELVALRHAGRIVLGGRIAPRHPWRRGRNLDHAGALSASMCATDAIADFRPSSIAMEKQYRWLSAQRPVPFAWQAQDLHPSGAVGRRDTGLGGEGRKAARSRRACLLRVAGRCRKFDRRRCPPGPQS